MHFLQIGEAGELAKEGVGAARELGGSGLVLMFVIFILITSVFVFLYIYEKKDHRESRIAKDKRISEQSEKIVEMNTLVLGTLSDLKLVFESLRMETGNGQEQIKDKIDNAKGQLQSAIDGVKTEVVRQSNGR